MPQGRAAAKELPGITLAEALEAAGGEVVLDGGERLRIMDALVEVLGGMYAHLPQKRAAYAVDPVQALMVLRERSADLSDAGFHLALTRLVTNLRDAHTIYIGPKNLAGHVAALPFLVEQYGPYSDPTFVVSHVARDAVPDPSFVEGVTLRAWNGVPFTRAVEVHADRATGGRPDARRARALESLTLRALDYGPPPDEMWVIVDYTTLEGRKRHVKLDWRVLESGQPSTSAAGPRALRRAVDPAREAIRRARQMMFAPQIWDAHRRGRSAARRPGELETTMPGVLAARELEHDGDRFGYLRIWSFSVDDDEAFVQEIIRLVEQLPPDGLVIDLRDNPGGLIYAAERTLQLFTPNRIVPTRFALLATPLTRAMASSPFNAMELGPWADSLDAALTTGDLYSRPLPLTDPDWCNDVGQHYDGPVVAVVDANTYSSGDLFAAGFVDNDVGTLVSVGDATGAGGANVWTSRAVRDALLGTTHALPELPEGVSFNVAFRRAIRSGPSDGIPIEDLGVQGQSYAMTRADLLEDNVDLLTYCSTILAAAGRRAPARRVDAAADDVIDLTTTRRRRTRHGRTTRGR